MHNVLYEYYVYAGIVVLTQSLFNRPFFTLLSPLPDALQFKNRLASRTAPDIIVVVEKFNNSKGPRFSDMSVMVNGADLD